MLADLVPLLIFFAAFKLYGILTATAVLVATTLAQVSWRLFRGHRVPPFLWLVLGATTVLGLSTLIIGDERFLKLKPTAVYWALAISIAVSRLVFGRDLLKQAIGERLILPAAAWARMSWSWCGFFLSMGALNLYVAREFSTEAWVNFKVFWTTGLILVFSLLQGFLIANARDATDDA